VKYKLMILLDGFRESVNGRCYLDYS
jgi:hypothetical protein